MTEYIESIVRDKGKILIEVGTTPHGVGFGVTKGDEDTKRR